MRDLPTHRASRIGTFASDILTASGEADVIAVFERSFYLLCEKGIVAVCLDDLGAGPINILVPARGADAPWQGVVRDGMKAAVTSSGIVVHGGFVLDVTTAATWSPPAWEVWSPERARPALIQLHAHARALLHHRRNGVGSQISSLLMPVSLTDRGQGPAIRIRDLSKLGQAASVSPGKDPGFDAHSGARIVRDTADMARPEGGKLASGVAALVFDPASPEARTPSALAARDQVRAITTALPQALQSQQWQPDALRAATLLVGLGPGLTPSGDDLLGGLMLALTARGEMGLRDALFDSIVDELNDLTVPVSAMHLTAAAYGQGHESMHAALNTILAGDAAQIAAVVDAVASIGATSGLDALAGIFLGLS